jgi:hypothetical protein
MIAAAKRQGFPVKGSDLLAQKAAETAATAKEKDEPKGDQTTRFVPPSGGVGKPMGGAAKIDPETGEPKRTIDGASV